MNIKSEKLLKLLSIIIFCIYIILVIWVIMFKCNLVNSFTDTYLFFKDFTVQERFNFYLVPFKDYIEGPFLSQIDNIIQDDILNISLFIPFGLYLAFFIKKNRFLKIFLFSFIFSSFFELFQLYSLIGSFATKDIVTNTLGGCIGALLCFLIYKKHNSELKITIFNIISIVVIVVCILILIYAVSNTIKHIDLYISILKRTY